MFHSLWICLSKEELSVTAFSSFMVNFRDFFYSHYNLDFYIIFLCAWLSPNIFSGSDLRTLQRKENGSYLVIHSFLNVLNDTFLFWKTIRKFTSYLITNFTVILLQFICDFNIWHQIYFVVVKFSEFANNCNL